MAQAGLTNQIKTFMLTKGYQDWILLALHDAPYHLFQLNRRIERAV